MKLKNWTKYLVIIDNKLCEAWYLNNKFVPKFGVFETEEVTVIKKLTSLKVTTKMKGK